MVPNVSGSNGCLNCSQHQLWNARQFNGSNMSLNMPMNGYYPQQWMMNGSYCRHDIYGTGLPPVVNNGRYKLN